MHVPETETKNAAMVAIIFAVSSCKRSIKLLTEVSRETSLPTVIERKKNVTPPFLFRAYVISGWCLGLSRVYT